MTERIAPFLDFLDHEVDTDFTDPECEIEIFLGSVVAEHRQQGVLEITSNRSREVKLTQYQLPWHLQSSGQHFQARVAKPAPSIRPTSSSRI